MRPNSVDNANEFIPEKMPINPEGKILVQFDGLCILCSRTIQFLLKRDRKRKFLFQTLQKYSEAQSFDTVVVIDQHQTFQYFDAVLKIGFELGGIYQLIAIFRIIPRSWRHSLYLWIAKNRFKWFGKRESCYFPTKEVKERFI